MMESVESDWEPELLESHLLGHDPEGEEFQDLAPTQPSKRGPKKLPILWSRVISISEDGDEDIGAHNIEFDLQEMINIPRMLPPRRDAGWTLIFQPSSYSKAHPDISLEAYSLGEKRFRSLGVEVSKLREELRKAAMFQAKKEALEQGQDIFDISRLARRA